ncbi:hypothetical protein M9H77_08306 [Catharanthus roseus]|uniref:Uncharacterized protein n=1 Tax=Catharanthus roseus TaxID=4058 RepID=A0ACC0BXE4_CATRO|nr:hypothetical protein M9H77_08306 [Catharanthus roseus]
MYTRVIAQYHLMYSPLGYDKTSTAKAGPYTQSPLMPGLYMASMLCPPVSVVIPPKRDQMQIKTSITFIRYILSPCKLTNHTSGIVILHYLITDEWDLCPPQVR